MKRKILTALMFCALFVADISYVAAQGDAYFYEYKSEERASMTPSLLFGDFNDTGDLNFESFNKHNDAALGNSLLLMAGLAFTYRLSRRRK